MRILYQTFSVVFAAFALVAAVAPIVSNGDPNIHELYAMTSFSALAVVFALLAISEKE